MQQRTLATLAIATIAVVGAAGWVLLNQEKPASDLGDTKPLFPGLTASIDQVARIEVVEGGRTTTVSRKDDGTWIVDAKEGYRADLDRVKSTVVGLAQAEILEPRTDQPDLFARIGVEDPASSGATSRGLRLLDKDGKALAGLVIGKENYQTGSINQTANYARRTGENQSWLIRARMERMQADPIRWIDRSLPKLVRDRVMAIEIRQADGRTVSMARPAPVGSEYTLTGLPEGAKPKMSLVSEVTGAVNLFSIDDLAKRDDARFAAGTTAIYRSFDGVVLTVHQVKDGEARWLAFDVAFDADTAKAFADSKAPGLLPVAEAEAEVKAWQANYASWAFKVADAMGDAFARTPDDFVEKPAAP